MNDYSSFSPSSIEDFLLFGLNLDEEVVKIYFYPRWKKYEEQWIVAILQQGIGKKATPDFVLAYHLLTDEPWARSKIKSTLSTSLSDSEIVSELVPFHRDIRNFLEYARAEVLNFSPPMVQILLKEKESYQILLEELTQIIRNHSSIAGSVESLLPIPSELPLTNTVAKVQVEVCEKFKQEMREEEILVTLKPEALERVMVAFLPFVKSEQEQTLLQLFTTGTSSEPIFFNESRLILGDIFRKLKDKKVLIGVVYYTELAKWLSKHFYFKNKKKKGFTPVSEKSIKDLMQNGEKPKFGVNFNFE